MKKFDVIAYTDGSCLINPGPGGWAAILVRDGIEQVMTGYEPQTTNNRMELRAALSVLESISDKNLIIEIHTDSEYLKKGITEWMPVWKARNWKRKAGALANLDLWQALDAQISRLDVRWYWLRGHNGHHFNTRVDKLARQAIRQSMTNT